MLNIRFIVLPPVSTDGMTTSDVQSLADSVRDKMIAALKEISAPGPSQLHSEDDNDDDTVPLINSTHAETSTNAGDSQYGSVGNTGELRRRISSPSGKAEESIDKPAIREIIEAGALDEGVSLGAREAVLGKDDNTPISASAVEGDADGTEDELDDDGAVLVKRPE